MEATYRTGQVAKLLETSSHHIRRLIEAGLLDAEVTEGNRYRIPAAEVERLKRDGLPPIPQVSPAEDPAPAGAIAAARPWPIAEDPPEPAVESDAVQEERDGLTIAETQLKRRRVDLERETVEDEFRERERKKRIAQQAEALRKEAEQEAQRRREWEESWIQAAMAAIPDDAAPEFRLEVYRQVEAVLKSIDWRQSADITRRVVEAAAYQALQPHFQARRRADAIAQALRPIPASATAYRTKAKRAAEVAMAKLPAHAVPDDLREAADAAVAPIVAEIRHEAAKNEVLDSMRYWGWLDATPEEQQQAKAAVAEALEAVPVGNPTNALMVAKNAALAPFEKAIQQRQEAKRRREVAVQVAENDLWRVDKYLRENVTFDSLADQWEEERRLKDELRPALIRALLDGLSPDETGAFIEEWLDENVAVEDEDDEEDDYDDEE